MAEKYGRGMFPPGRMWDGLYAVHQLGDSASDLIEKAKSMMPMNAFAPRMGQPGAMMGQQQTFAPQQGAQSGVPMGMPQGMQPQAPAPVPMLRQPQMGLQSGAMMGPQQQMQPQMQPQMGLGMNPQFQQTAMPQNAFAPRFARY